MQAAKCLTFEEELIGSRPLGFREVPARKRKEKGDAKTLQKREIASEGISAKSLWV